MKTQLELTRTFYPDQLYIELSEEQMINAWNQAQTNFQNDIIRWRAYLNYLVVEAIPQIKSELGLEEKLGYYPSDLSKVLQFINGTILTLGETRLVVIPSDGNIGGDLCVPQELVDLPGFAGDYYLGVYINLEEEWLRFWGACSHKKLTTEGVYDESTRNYYLDRDELIEDLEAVLIAREICPNERGEYKFANLPSLSESEANVLLEQVKQPDCYVPRLAVDSPIWLSLFVNHLVVNKPAIAKPKRSLDVKLPSFSSLLKDISLRNTSVDDWNFDIAMINTRRVRQNYQGNINRMNTRGGTLRSPTQADDNQAGSLANLAGMAIPWVVGIAAIPGATYFLMWKMKEIHNFVENCINLINDSDKDIVKVIALELGNSNKEIPSEIINALAQRIETMDDSETRWQLALTLGKLDPEHPLGAVGQRKKIKLSADDWFYLFLALRVGKGDLIDVLIEVTSATYEYLPIGLQVSLLDGTSKAVANEEERYLSLEFAGAIGQFFSVKFSLEDNDLIENFVI